MHYTKNLEQYTSSSARQKTKQAKHKPIQVCVRIAPPIMPPQTRAPVERNAVIVQLKQCQQIISPTVKLRM